MTVAKNDNTASFNFSDATTSYWTVIRHNYDEVNGSTRDDVNSTAATSYAPAASAAVAFNSGLYFINAFRWWITLFIVSFAMFGNSMTLLAVFTTEKLRVKTYVMVTSLAVADLAFSIVNINVLVHDYWNFTACRLATYKNIVRPLERFVIYSSFLHIAIVAFDRYVAIMHPLNYETKMTSSTYRNLIIGVWVFSASISLPVYVSFLGIYPPDVKLSPTPCIVTLWPTVESMLELIIYIINSSIVLLVYVKLWTAAIHHGKRQMEQQAQQVNSISSSVVSTPNAAAAAAADASNDQATSSKTEPNSAERNKSLLARILTKKAAETKTATKLISYHKMVTKHRATRTILALLLLYIVMWFPYFWARILYTIGWPPAFTVWMYSGVIGATNMSINFVVYAVMNRDFRAAYKRILHIGSNVVHAQNSVTS